MVCVCALSARMLARMGHVELFVRACVLLHVGGCLMCVGGFSRTCDGLYMCQMGVTCRAYTVCHSPQGRWASFGPSLELNAALGKKALNSSLLGPKIDLLFSLAIFQAHGLSHGLKPILLSCLGCPIGSSLNLFFG